MREKPAITRVPRTEKLVGENIPIGARVFAVADTLDAMSGDRVYRKALPYEVARAEMIKYSGAQFDPEVVHAFLEIPPEKWDEIKNVAAESDALNWHRFF